MQLQLINILIFKPPLGKNLFQTVTKVSSPIKFSFSRYNIRMKLFLIQFPVMGQNDLFSFWKENFWCENIYFLQIRQKQFNQWMKTFLLSKDAIIMVLWFKEETSVYIQNHKFWSGFFHELTCFHSKSKIISFVLSMYSANFTAKYFQFNTWVKMYPKLLSELRVFPKIIFYTK